MTSWLPYQTTPPERNKISNMRLLNHVNDYKRGEKTKQFTLFSEPLGAGVTPPEGCNTSDAGRFSMIQYMHPTERVSYYGMITCIVLYEVKDEGAEELFLGAVIARLTIDDSKEKSVFPLPKYKFQKRPDRRYALDQILFQDITGPLFYVHQGVEDLDVSSTKITSESRFHVLSEDIIHCEHRLSYDDYISNNRIVGYKGRRSSILDLNVYMTIDEMCKLQQNLGVEKRIATHKKKEEIVNPVDDEVHMSDIDISSSSSEEDDIDEDF